MCTNRQGCLDLLEFAGRRNQSVEYPYIINLGKLKAFLTYESCGVHMAWWVTLKLEIVSQQGFMYRYGFAERFSK